MSLKTNYEDAVLDVDVNTKRRYNVIRNMDGTVSLEDVTTYIKKGSDFGANDINNTNNAINQISAELLAEDNLKFQFTKSGNDYGYKDSNGNFHPFRKVQASKTVTAGTSAKTVSPDSGYHGIASVTVNPQPHTATRATVTSNGTIDLGANHATRYVPVNVPTSPTGYAYSWMLRGTSAQKYSNCTQMTAVSGELEGIYIKANVTGKYWDNVSNSERTVNAGDTIVSTSVPGYSNFTFIMAFYLG